MLRRAYGVGSIDEEVFLNHSPMEPFSYLGNVFTVADYYAVKQQCESLLLQANGLPRWAAISLLLGVALASRSCSTCLIRLALWSRAVLTCRSAAPWSRVRETADSMHEASHGQAQRKALAGSPPPCDVGLVAVRCVRFEARASKALVLRELWLGGELGEVSFAFGFIPALFSLVVNPFRIFAPSLA